MLTILKDFIARNRRLDAVDRLGPRDLGDLDLNQDEMRLLAAVPDRVIERQSAMARRLGLSDRSLSRYRHDHVAALDRCRDCRAVAECRHFLSDATAPGEAADFCPNRQLFSMLASAERH